MNFIKRNQLLDLRILSNTIESFIKYKTSLVRNIEADKVFLADYYGVLENTLLAISNTRDYFVKYNIEDKYELLGELLDLQEKHIVQHIDKYKITEKGFGEKVNRRVGSRKRKRTIFVDEAQDCHHLEREILYFLFGNNNIVISSGGKEQLIRLTELCNWEVYNRKKIISKKVKTSNKSFRLKRTILDFCNYLAKAYQIDLQLEALENEDEGELIFDFRNDLEQNETQDLFEELKLKGEVNGCTPYESLLVLIDSESKINRKGDQHSIEVHEGKINEYGNIEDSKTINKSEWKYKSILKDQISFWDGTDDKGQKPIPNSNESRLIYYDSCRGLEAWAVACFNIDQFFIQKKEDLDAEKYLVEDLFLNLQNDKRKSMFAATWVLMAVTRAIDTLYLQVKNKDSELGKVISDYLKTQPKNVRVLSNKLIGNI